MLVVSIVRVNKCHRISQIAVSVDQGFIKKSENESTDNRESFWQEHFETTEVCHVLSSGQ